MKQTDPTIKQKALTSPILMLIRGIPGSGKSYLAEVIRKTIGADMVVLLDPDSIDYTSDSYIDLSKSLAAEGVEEKFYPNRFLKSEAYEAVKQGKLIIWNQPFTDAGGFERTIDSVRTFAAEQHIPLPILLVEVEVDHETAKQRVSSRKAQGGHGPSDGRFTRFTQEYISFGDKGYRTVIVHGEDNVAQSAAIVMRALHEL
jgi:predicted kinase